ncbi:GbsR/MarR family transcriptional regulator [Tenacibaculum maritimum]|uniref:HTH-type transcriptional regulator n=1 Tax=Tenacibaculum maritimum NCIMB 2154 TaxID=1349785 RepID=A0A2H1EBW0_9FLAO|nr:transcriptional regulator [Tenacibaculum maritimum]MCD9562947.1 transcriptional regulator [Tenacibaculum maritimum]MCD9565492.1 transcriptional regulator [Tenacibaculum maritimum]MCD9578050.1 transcriptional regulator [Tenacibaculum maritimum]MCD9581878.1 transcriptional regulator [Tenacibaculum maritimum]MCD9585214.1 transcriptional regulator [Tenacibaculum maritimum]
MNLEDAKLKYIHTWGSLATNWGINKTMAQVHALLLVSTTPLSAENIMEALKISRGNVNMNVRALIDWGIVRKEFIAGERKEFFVADKDIWELFKQITKERKKREIEPVLKILQELQDEVEETSEEVTKFKKVMRDLSSVTTKVNGILDKVIKADEHWLLSNFTKIIKR